MSPHQIATELTSITDHIVNFWDGDGDRRDCLTDVEDRITALISRIWTEDM